MADRSLAPKGLLWARFLQHLGYPERKYHIALNRLPPLR